MSAEVIWRLAGSGDRYSCLLSQAFSSVAQWRRGTARASADAFQNSFGQGGNKKVSLVARLDPQTGDILRATFLRATLQSGETNSLDVNAIEVQPDGTVLVTGDSAFTPPLEPAGTCINGPFDGYEATFDAALTILLSGVVPGCL